MIFYKQPTGSLREPSPGLTVQPGLESLRTGTARLLTMPALQVRTVSPSERPMVSGTIRSQWSSLIGSDQCVVHSHWSRLNEARLSLVQSLIVLLRQCLLCHKEPARRIQSPLQGAFCLLLAGSLWHKGAYNRTFPCMEANYPYVIKNQ